jgi:hypothetical protein
VTVDREFLKRLAELLDGDAWQRADLMVEKFPADQFGDAEDKDNTGLYAELELYATELGREYGIEAKASTMRQWRATALKWPDDMRVSSASYEAHKALRGPDRFELMRTYLRKNKGRPLSGRAVTRYRAEDAPAKSLPPWEERVRRRIESTAKSLVLGNVIVKREDWWTAKAASPYRRETVAAALRAVAREISP